MGSYIFENDFLGSYMGILFPVGIIGHSGIEIGKDGRTVVILRMVGIVDAQVFDDDAVRHIRGITEIMLSGIGSTDQAGTGYSASCRYENTIPDDEFPLPGTAVVGAKIDEGSSVKGGILNEKGPGADSVYSHMPKRGVADSGIGHTHVGIKAGKGTVIQNQVFAEVGTHNSPVGSVVDIIGLATMLKRDVEGPADRDVVAAHGDGNTCRSNGLVGFVSGQDAVPDRYIRTVAEIKEAAIWRAMFSFTDDAVFEPIHKDIGTSDGDAAAVIGVL